MFFIRFVTARHSRMMTVIIFIMLQIMKASASYVSVLHAMY